MAKLVEILARELTGWPDADYGGAGATGAITQDRGGELNTLDGGRHQDQGGFEGGVWAASIWTLCGISLDQADDFESAIVTRAQWQAAVDALKQKEVAERGGEGDPAAGTLCELRNVAAGTEWGVATIVFASRNVIVWDWADEPAINGLCTAYRHAVEVRPIRTPEQIAVEDREKFIDEMIKVTCIRRGEAGLIYDAGYRKQEPK